MTSSEPSYRPQMSTFTGIFDTNAEQREESFFWQEILEDVLSGRASFEKLLSLLKEPLIQQPSVRFSASREGQTLLHLAVLFDRLDVIAKLASDSKLRRNRNHFGLSPIDWAELLDKREALDLFYPGKKMGSFLQRKRVQLSHPSDRIFSALRHLCYPIFSKQTTLFQVLEEAKKLKLQDKISSEKVWLGSYFDREIHKGLHAYVSVRWIGPEIGYGVFAQRRIDPCAFVGEYTGWVRSRQNFVKNTPYVLPYFLVDAKKEKWVIDAGEGGNFTRFINHSSRPNLALQPVYWRGMPRMIFVALREIQEEEQLTFDYGLSFVKEFSSVLVSI